MFDPMTWAIFVFIAKGLGVIFSSGEKTITSSSGKNIKIKPEDTPKILLDGNQESGKDTLIHILQGKGFRDNYEATTISKDEWVEANNSLYLIKNVAGSKAARMAKEEIRQKAFEKSREQDGVVTFVYVFDASKFLSNKKAEKQIIDEIDIFKEEIFEENHKHKRKHKIRLKILGTRGDQIETTKINNIENTIKIKSLVDCKVFDMTKNPQNALMNFIIGD
ncbi:hypothetical protein OFO10_05620 [Campylobacter sp. VBCF_06 NA8]|uniref:hypothetical protein n=1 Tax=Campylobacter sp. VBCF_06 NA8 TaxID=2983822 RepID=UPI0022E9CD98|nr:hypothetical protein [Campylobacter sp. VBCF_06 NA8]MDA3046632.1 hypothetical protein [Campylobacter sp. VBCF_06 NA8]